MGPVLTTPSELVRVRMFKNLTTKKTESRWRVVRKDRLKNADIPFKLMGVFNLHG